MGTTCTYLGNSSEREELTRAMKPFIANRFDLTKISGGYAYAAHVTDADSCEEAEHLLAEYVPTLDNRVVFGGYIKTSRHQGEFCYKGIGEQSGPGSLCTAAKILDALTPLRPRPSRAFIHAYLWRENSRRHLDQLRRTGRLKEGDEIVFDHELDFGHTTIPAGTVITLDRTYRKKQTFNVPGVGRARIRNWRTRGRAVGSPPPQPLLTFQCVKSFSWERERNTSAYQRDASIAQALGLSGPDEIAFILSPTTTGPESRIGMVSHRQDRSPSEILIAVTTESEPLQAATDLKRGIPNPNIFTAREVVVSYENHGADGEGSPTAVVTDLRRVDTLLDPTALVETVDAWSKPQTDAPSARAA